MVYGIYNYFLLLSVITIKEWKPKGFLIELEFHQILCPDRYKLNLNLMYFLSHTHPVEFKTVDKQMYIFLYQGIS